jgi:pyruvate dehydrogenase E2 component (dihydrolipoamide acetyltransferase)
MRVEVILPKVDMDMTHGTLAIWHAIEGDPVQKGAALFDIETDKAAMEVEAPATGRLLHVAAKAGDRVPVGTVVAWIYPDGVEIESAPVESAVSIGAATPTVQAKTVAEVLAPNAKPGIEQGDKSQRKFWASPLARRLARENGIDLGTVTGSGPHGRIQKVDIEAAVLLKTDATTTLDAAPEALRPTEAPEPFANQSITLSVPASAELVKQTYAGRPHTAHLLDGMRRTIAARLTESKQTIPHFYLRRDVRLDALIELRRQINEELAPRNLKVSVNDFIILACARALQQVPAANAVWAGDRVLRMVHSDVAVAVSVEGGLFTPVIKDAESKTLTALSSEMKSLAARARDRKLTPADYQGGSMAISNLGMYGIDSFDAIINPPQSSILAVGAATLRPVAQSDRSIATATVISLTLSVDHRVIDGALGAELIQSITTNLERPLTLLA